MNFKGSEGHPRDVASSCEKLRYCVKVFFTKGKGVDEIVCVESVVF